MNDSVHTLSDVFSQLGLSSEPNSIERFIQTHRPLDSAVRLPDATFWNEAQRNFLRQQLSADADWAELIDQLDASLR